MAACCARTHSTVQKRRRTCGDLRNRRRCQGRTGPAVLSWIRPPATPGQPDAPLPADRVDCFLKPRITCRRRPGGSHDPVARPRFRRTDPAVRSRRSLRMRVHRCHPSCTGRADWSDRQQDCRHLPAPGRGSGHAQRLGFESAGIPIGVGSRPTTGKERGNVHLQRGSRYSCRTEQGVMGFRRPGVRFLVRALPHPADGVPQPLLPGRSASWAISSGRSFPCPRNLVPLMPFAGTHLV